MFGWDDIKNGSQRNGTGGYGLDSFGPKREYRRTNVDTTMRLMGVS